MHAADVRYHLDCWLVQACLHGAIVTTITTLLVRCKCNRQHRWLGIVIANMYAGPVQVYQTCMLVSTCLQNDTTASEMQLLRHGKWEGAIVTVMADGRVQMFYTWMVIR